MTKDSLYLPNLNGVRCIAAFMVILSHIELNKSYFGIGNTFHNVKVFGKLGVTLFFVLSGFLITYLLLHEKERYGKIKISFFYFRRILRIWPLYYFIVLLSLFVLPYFNLFKIPHFRLEFDTDIQFFITCFLFAFFLPNLLISIKLIPFATQTWSIGTEEQFYAIWPIIINRIKNLKKMFLFIISFYYIVIFCINLSLFDSIKYIVLIREYCNMLQLDALTLGSLGAYSFYKIDKSIELITANVSLILSIFVLTMALLYDVEVPFFNSLFYALLFVILIINLVYKKILLRVLENQFFNYLGTISYGLYMYHQIAIVLCINVLLKFHIMNDVALYVSSIVITVLIAGLSHKFLEKPFLTLKNKWSVFNSNIFPENKY